MENNSGEERGPVSSVLSNFIRFFSKDLIQRCCYLLLLIHIMPASSEFDCNSVLKRNVEIIVVIRNNYLVFTVSVLLKYYSLATQW